MVYVGKACLFNFLTKYQFSLAVRHEVSLAPGLLHWAYHASGAEKGVEAIKKVAVAAFVPPNSAMMADIDNSRAYKAALAAAPATARKSTTLTGSVQFVLHENLARKRQADPAALADVGKTTVVARFGKKRPAAARPKKPKNEVVLPSVKDYLASDGHVAASPDDQVMEVLSNKQLADLVEQQLKRLGLDDDTIGQMPPVLTEPANLTASVGGLRPGPIKHTFTQKVSDWKGGFPDRPVALPTEASPTT